MACMIFGNFLLFYSETFHYFNRKLFTILIGNFSQVRVSFAASRFQTSYWHHEHATPSLLRRTFMLDFPSRFCTFILAIIYFLTYKKLGNNILFDPLPPKINAVLC